MSETYIISIDQSTQGTKALLLDAAGTILRREDMAHRQIISGEGWVSHNPQEIYKNTITVVKNLIENSGVNPGAITGVGISNQRETCLAWNKSTGEPIADAIVWQCSRAKEICERIEKQGADCVKNAPDKIGVSEWIFKKTGLKLSPYFPASKLAWLMEHMQGARELEESGQLCMGTMDTWLVYCLTGKKQYKTDYSNASRTQLFNVHTLSWDEELCRLFGLNAAHMAEVFDSDSCFGETDFEGILPQAVPIHGVLGDSHAALFAQGCVREGMAKATYGTGSSIMMNTGETAMVSTHGVVTSLAWKLGGKVNYVLEGNINYTGAVISWLKDEVKLITSPGETEDLCRCAAQDDELYLIPAFSGLGAPYWESKAKGILSGITRTTRREEIVRAAIESIAYQITDVVEAMGQDAGMRLGELRVDGGPTRNGYLMQFQSDMLGAKVAVADSEEMSALGAGYAAGIALGIYEEKIAEKMGRKEYQPQMEEGLKTRKKEGWKAAVGQCIGR